MPYPVSTSDFVVVSDHNDIQSVIYDIVGLGSNGYGITDFDTRPVTTRFVVSAFAWKSMLSTLDRIKRHQTDQNLYYGSTLTNELVLAKSSRTTGTFITAELHNFINTTTQELLAGRYTVHPNQLSPVISTGGTSVRQNDWTSQTIEHVIEVSWPTELIARYFFNLGGYLIVSAGHENNSFGGNNDAWKALIATIPAQLYERSDFVSGGQTKTYPVVNGVAPYDGLTYRAVATKVAPAKIVFSITFIDAVALTPPPPDPVTIPSIVVLPSSARWNVLLQPVSSFAVINPLPGQGTYVDIGPTLDDVAIIFNPNGTFRIESEYGLASFAGNWGTPTTVTAGSNYWIRFNPIGVIPPGVVATGWLSMTSVRQAIVAATAVVGQGLVTRSVTYQIEISSNSLGTAVVTSGVYTLEANATNSLFRVRNPLPDLSFAAQIQYECLIKVSYESDGYINARAYRVVSYSVTENTTGFYEEIVTSYSSPYTWGIPITPNVGQNYWIRFIKISDLISGSGAVGLSDSTDSTGWLQLNQSREVFARAKSISEGVIERRTVTYNVSISATASDAGIVASATLFLDAQADPPPTSGFEGPGPGGGDGGGGDDGGDSGIGGTEGSGNDGGDGDGPVPAKVDGNGCRLTVTVVG